MRRWERCSSWMKLQARASITGSASHQNSDVIGLAVHWREVRTTSDNQQGNAKVSRIIIVRCRVIRSFYIICKL